MSTTQITSLQTKFINFEPITFIYDVGRILNAFGTVFIQWIGLLDYRARNTRSGNFHAPVPSRKAAGGLLDTHGVQELVKTLAPLLVVLVCGVLRTDRTETCEVLIRIRFTLTSYIKTDGCCHIMICRALATRMRAKEASEPFSASASSW